MLNSLFAFQAMGGSFLGRVSDQHGRKTLFLLSTVGCAIGYLVMGLAGSLYMMVFSRLLVGFCKQSITAAQAVVADTSTNKTRAAR